MDPNGWLLVDILGEHPGFFSESALDHLDLQQNATHRTNFFEGVVDGVTIPGEKNEPMLGSTVFSHERKRIATKKDVKLPDPGGKKTKI